MTYSREQFEAARKRIAGAVQLTPCRESIPLSELCGCQVFAKLEYQQRTGSFKERGARNALLLLNDEQRKRGVVAASAGNHALGLAYHGQLLNIPVSVVMPEYAPLIKVSSSRKLGAHVVIEGQSFAQARAAADKLVERDGLSYIHGYDDEAIIIGQGTIGLELLEQVPDLDAVIVPIGGAGLIAGVGSAIKAVKPSVEIIGVEALNAAGYSAALAAGEPVDVETHPTLADGLAVGKIGARSFSIAREVVDCHVAVDENDLALAIYRLMELEKSVVEGSAAASLAALLSGKLDNLKGKRVAIILCGGNIDLTILDRVIEHGLVTDGRLCRFTGVISDRPGGLAVLTQAIADAGGSVKDISHDRPFSGPDMAAVRAVCTVETTDREHIERLLDAVRAAGIEVIV